MKCPHCTSIDVREFGADEPGTMICDNCAHMGTRVHFGGVQGPSGAVLEFEEPHYGDPEGKTAVRVTVHQIDNQSTANLWLIRQNEYYGLLEQSYGTPPHWSMLRDLVVKFASDGGADPHWQMTLYSAEIGIRGRFATA